MFDTIRSATPEEVQKIAENSDLGPNTYVAALDTPEGTILGVVRLCHEVDPVHFPPTLSTRWKTIFMRDIANFLKGQGASSYYFNIHASEEAAPIRETMLHWGAEQVSTAPELRFKKVLPQ